MWLNERHLINGDWLLLHIKPVIPIQYRKKKKSHKEEYFNKKNGVKFIFEHSIFKI